MSEPASPPPAAVDNLDRIRSAWPGMIWPAIPPQPGQLALALQFQLDRTQWLSPERLLAEQLRQLRVLLAHAHASVPFYADRLAAAGYRPGATLDPQWFFALPLLTRAEVHARGEDLRSRALRRVTLPRKPGAPPVRPGRRSRISTRR